MLSRARGDTQTSDSGAAQRQQRLHFPRGGQLREKAEQLRAWRPWRRPGGRDDASPRSDPSPDSVEELSLDAFFSPPPASGSRGQRPPRLGLSWEAVLSTAKQDRAPPTPPPGQEGSPTPQSPTADEESLWAAAELVLAAHGLAHPEGSPTSAEGGLRSPAQPRPPVPSPTTPSAPDGAPSHVPAAAAEAVAEIDAVCLSLEAELAEFGAVAQNVMDSLCLACCSAPARAAAAAVDITAELQGIVSHSQGEGCAPEISQLRHHHRKGVLACQAHATAKVSSIQAAMSAAVGQTGEGAPPMQTTVRVLREVLARCTALALAAVDEACERAMMPTDDYGFLISDWDLHTRITRSIDAARAQLGARAHWTPPYANSDPEAVAQCGFGSRRRDAWLELSGAGAALAANQGLYEALSSEHDPQVARDVARTFQSCRTYAAAEGEGRQRLTRVLQRFSAHYAHGYCQAMSFIAAALLLVLAEEEAFWALDAIVQGERYSLDYYTRGEGGGLQQCVADMEVLDTLIAARMPGLSRELPLPPSLICFQWFMCIFVHCVQPPFAFLILDLYLLLGQPMLFELAFGVITRHGPDVLGLDGHDAAARIKQLLRADAELLPLLAAAAGPQGLTHSGLAQLRAHPLSALRLREHEAEGRAQLYAGEELARRALAAEAPEPIGVCGSLAFDEVRRLLERGGARLCLSMPRTSVGGDLGCSERAAARAAARRLGIPIASPRPLSGGTPIAAPQDPPPPGSAAAECAPLQAAAECTPSGSPPPLCQSV